MKKILFVMCLVALITAKSAFSYTKKFANEPDSVYLFSYGTSKNSHKNGLHIAWSRDKEKWYTIGNEFSYVRSDYGTWGAEKRMLTPYLMQGPNGVWNCIWSLNEKDNVFAHASSIDLVDWGRQSYPVVNKGSNLIRPVLRYDKNQSAYHITYLDANNKAYKVSTADFKSYTPAVEIPAAQYSNPSVTISLPGGNVTGQIHKVAWTMVDKLIKTYQLKQYKNGLHNESAKQDAERFKDLKPVNASITVEPQKAKPISDVLLGIFFEDINYAADGGLYAELVQNRDFEYSLRDKKGRDKNWNSTHSWSLKGESTSFTIDSISPVHINNAHYAVLETKVPGASLLNSGFDGIVVKKGEKYNFSLFAKSLNGKGGKLFVRLVDKKGAVLAQSNLSVPSGGWKNVKAVLDAAGDADDASLELQPLSAGRLALDMISLFPQRTYKGRKNGLRADLAQTIADIHPRFVRFPGGCVAHGDGIGNIYRWKNSIGPLESRKPLRNLWGYHQTTGLGYFEYFQFCEDIGAVPLPVVAAGVPCQNSSDGGAGQQGGIPMEEMDEYIQEIFDLVEWANGDVNTKWGKKRAEAGHPEPFNLKYLGVGNEDLITDIFEERFTMIFNAMKKKHPEITVIGTVGPSAEGTDYEEGWEIATKLKVPMVDEHYYQSPGWFINNQEYYDKYDRSKPKVYLGEYAASVPRGVTNHETALSEALYLTSLERNSDVVSMASYAPLLAKEGHTQWNPDLIYFNNTSIKPTVSYYVQQLYGSNAGTEYLPASLSLSNDQEAVKKRIAYSVVRDAKNKNVVVKLVNLLPVAVNSSIDLKDINIASTKAIKTVLQGNPDDRDVKPNSTDFTVSDKFNTELAPYSFTVIRIKVK